MEMKLIEKVVIKPEKLTERRRIFLSNLDLILVKHMESIAFFDLPKKNMSFSEYSNMVCNSLSHLLVAYDFFAGRLVPAIEEKDRFEIDCNGAGILFAAATTQTRLSQLGHLLEPKPEFKNLVRFLHDQEENELGLKGKPLLHAQLTQFGCGSLAIGIRYNHCVLDGIGMGEFQANWAALSRGDALQVVPNPDRTIFKHRNPPIINHSHLEFSKAFIENSPFSPLGMDGTDTINTSVNAQSRLIYLSRQHLASLKKAALKDGELKSCTIFQVVAAKIWKARSIAMNMEDEIFSTVLFPTNVRNIVKPQAPDGFAGNGLLNSFAGASVKKLKEMEDSYIVGKVQEGMRRLDDEYVRSAIDWLQVHKGLPCVENSFSVVAWWRLKFQDDEFAWGKLKCTSPVAVNPYIVFLLPDLKDEGGVNICLQLPGAEMEEFIRLMM